MVASLHECMASLAATGPVPVDSLPVLEEAHSCLEKESASPSMASLTLESFLNVGTVALQEPLPPTPISSDFLSHQVWETESEPVLHQKTVGVLRLEPEPPQLQQDLLSPPVTQQQLSPRQQSPSSITYAGIPQSYFPEVHFWAKVAGILAAAPTTTGGLC
jgi:hypothetical protein